MGTFRYTTGSDYDFLDDNQGFYRLYYTNGETKSSGFSDIESIGSLSEGGDISLTEYNQGSDANSLTDAEGRPLSIFDTGYYLDYTTAQNGTRLFGGELGDYIRAGSGDDFLGGEAGDDHLYGNGGDDTLNGGQGADYLDGGDGINTASYQYSSEGVMVNLKENTAEYGDAQDDTFMRIQNLIGSDRDDTLIGDDSANVLQGGRGADHLDGGAGINTASYKSAYDGVTIDLGAHTASGSDADGDVLINIQNLTGGYGNDILIGDASVNVLQGGAGADTLEGGAGADTLDGGTGSNTASYAGSSVGVTIDLVAHTASGGDAEGDVLINIQNLIGGSGNDTLIGDASANVLEGGAGADRLDGGVGGGSNTASYKGSTVGVMVNLGAHTASGGDADGDVLVNIQNLNGSSEADVLVGDGNANTLRGGGGADMLYGGAGSDRLIITEAGASVHGGSGSDKLFLQGSDTFTFDDNIAFDSIETVYVGDGASLDLSSITKSATIISQSKLIYVGENGYDEAPNVITGTKAKDKITGGEGSEHINGGGGNDILKGGSGFSELHGNEGNDTLTGIGGNTNLYGDDGNDILKAGIPKPFPEGRFVGREGGEGGEGGEGSTGNDEFTYLDGGKGDDKLYGSDGSDVFAFQKGFGRDNVYNFNSGEDRFDVSALVSNTKQIIINEMDNGNTVISFKVIDAGSKIIVHNVSDQHITLDDFDLTPTAPHNGFFGFD